ncbi:CapA family protein [Nocardioides sp.]|uniref:CapA family protein n=1 Tax=Nocardioides sp. TaxID=35761 RepID=UPI003511D366
MPRPRLLLTVACLAAVGAVLPVVIAVGGAGGRGGVPAPTAVADPVPAAAPSAAPPRTPDPPRTLTLTMGGDLLWHNTVWQAAQTDAARTGRGTDGYDFDPMFAGVRSWFADADLALCHEEVPFAAPGAAPRSYPLFAAPPAVAPWLASMGFDACTTASNHSLDDGFEGLVRTHRMLRAQGIAPVGTFPTAAARRRPVLLTTDDGVRVGIVAGTYGTNGLPLPEGRAWSVSLWDAENLLAQARRARAAGADIVVVHLHGDAEYVSTPTATQQALVARLTRSPDVDLVLGEHAHVVQPITRVNGTWVAYGMGNLVAQHETWRSDAYRGVVVRFTFTEQPAGSGGGFEVTGAEYSAVGWNVGGAGTPIRVRRLPPSSAGAQAVRADVTALGAAPGLRLR